MSSASLLHVDTNHQRIIQTDLIPSVSTTIIWPPSGRQSQFPRRQAQKYEGDVFVSIVDHTLVM